MHWTTDYLGLPYVKGDADCAALVCRVRREVFNGDVPSETEVERAASRLGRNAQISEGVELFGTPVSEPVDGDVVLMLCRGRPSHIGVYCSIDGVPYVLHAMENAGMVVLHRIRDLSKVFLSVDGYYAWK